MNNVFSYKDIVRKLKPLFALSDVYTILSDWFKMMALTIRNQLDVFEDEEHKEEFMQTVLAALPLNFKI